jgi:hypothetical protein
MNGFNSQVKNSRFIARAILDLNFVSSLDASATLAEL